MKISISSIGLLASFVAGSNDGQEQRELQRPLVKHVLTIRTDKFSEDVSIDYKCEGEQIWLYEKGSFTEPYHTIHLTASIPKGITCDLIVGDSETYADGLTDPEGTDPGFVSYVVDNEVLGFYQADGPTTDYAYLQFCSGDLCVLGRNMGFGGAQRCDQFISMYTTFGDFPSQNSWIMTCDGDEIWNEGGFLRNLRFETIENFACLDASACCNLEFRDTAKFRGRISPGTSGNFNVTLGSTTVAQYDGFFEDDVQSYTFGSGCTGNDRV